MAAKPYLKKCCQIVNDSVKKSLNSYVDLLKKADKFKLETNFA